MAQIEKPVLTLCIPIYNRLAYLERQLERFSEDKELFDRKIQLMISDNCSTDDLESCCKKFQEQGLKLTYHRQETNIGPDKNFEWGFYHAEGKYVWLLGSDDVPVSGFLKRLVGYLDDSDYGLVHLSMRKMDKEITIYHTSDDMAIAVNYWITFMSSNIIRTESLKNVDLTDYRKSFMIQVPAYLNACYSYQKNAIIYLSQFFEKDTDAANNGGYNIFEVFVTNLYGIYEEFVGNGLLSKQAFGKMIKIEYKEFLVGYIIKVLILGEKGNFKTENSWSALKKYYANKPYAYYYLLKKIVRRCLVGIVKPIIHHFRN